MTSWLLPFPRHVTNHAASEQQRPGEGRSKWKVEEHVRVDLLGKTPLMNCVHYQIVLVRVSLFSLFFCESNSGMIDLGFVSDQGAEVDLQELPDTVPNK